MTHMKEVYVFPVQSRFEPNRLPTKALPISGSVASVTRASIFQGKPCKRGHSGLRYESKNGSGGGCVECARAAAKARKARLRVD